MIVTGMNHDEANVGLDWYDGRVQTAIATILADVDTREARRAIGRDGRVYAAGHWGPIGIAAQRDAPLTSMN